ncbi:MAG: SHD1 domain-containing protein, partial [Planctomycetota bacterium]
VYISAAGEIVFWSFRAKRQRAAIPMETGTGNSFAFSRDGKLLAMDDGFGAVLLDPQSGKALRKFEGQHTQAVNCIALTPDAELLATGSMDGTAVLWDATTGQMKQALPRQRESVHAVALSPDGRLLASGSDGSIVFWDVSTGQIRHATEGHDGWTRCLAFSPNGRLLASGGDDDLVKVWDVAAGREIQAYQGHTDIVMGIAWSPDGSLVASGSFDKTVKLWRIEGSGVSDLAHPRPKPKEAAPRIRRPTPKRPPAELRTWTSSDGQFTVRARLVKGIGGDIYLEIEDGQTIRVPLDRLSEEDREYLKSRR